METRQAYRQILDTVSVTPEMEQRVLAGLRNALDRKGSSTYRCLLYTSDAADE